MEIRVLKYFLAVCREGTMSRAAASLHITQPTLSRQIADLERELGRTLLERGGKCVKLTQDGLYLRRRAIEIVRLAEQTESDLRAADTDLEGVVSITAGESWGLSGLASVMTAFRELHPRVSFSMHSGNTEDAIWRLEQGLSDFAVIMSYPNVGVYDHVRLATQDAWVLIVPEGHELACRDSVCPGDLRDIPLIVSEGTMEQGELATWFGSARSELNVAATYSLAFNAAMMVRAGLGCALAFDGLVPTGTNTGLASVKLNPRVASVIDLAWKDRATLAPPAAAFLAHLLEMGLFER